MLSQVFSGCLCKIKAEKKAPSSIPGSLSFSCRSLGLLVWFSEIVWMNDRSFLWTLELNPEVLSFHNYCARTKAGDLLCIVDNAHFWSALWPIWKWNYQPIYIALCLVEVEAFPLLVTLLKMRERCWLETLWMRNIKKWGVPQKVMMILIRLWCYCGLQPNPLPP